MIEKTRGEFVYVLGTRLRHGDLLKKGRVLWLKAHLQSLAKKKDEAYRIAVGGKRSEVPRRTTERAQKGKKKSSPSIPARTSPSRRQGVEEKSWEKRGAGEGKALNRRSHE